MVKKFELKSGNRTNFFEVTKTSDATFTIAHIGESVALDNGLNFYTEAVNGRKNLRTHKFSDLRPKSDKTGLHRAILDALGM